MSSLAPADEGGGGDIRTTTRHRPYGIVPEALVQDTRLSATACRLAVWLAIRPPGWIVRPSHVQEVLGIGRSGYYRARQDLVRAGYIAARQLRGPDGRLGAWEFTFDAAPESGQAPPKKSTKSRTGGDDASQKTASGAARSGRARSGGVSHIPLPSVPLPSSTTTTTVVGGDGDMDSLVWPAGLTSDQLSGAQQVLLGRWPGLIEAQAVLDEIAGKMPQGNVRNVVALLRTLLQKQQAGEFTPELGPDVRDARDARRRHEERLRRSVAAVAPQQPAAAGQQSEVARAEREKLRQRRAAW